MAHALTNHYEEVINRLIGSGRFANRSEVVRAGLRKLEEEFLGKDYLRPPPLSSGTLARVYRRQSQGERAEELKAVRASRKPRPGE
ncbi:MAG: type II toxin-antitoxin system ParD family antitoxin [Verrucomicrobia bacterium]|nr:type II toxin-antitoxin system ParD family antitoxin [Verrucomicrobiota bacterium]